MSADLELARRIAESVPDPELPMLTLADLGILRDVTVEGDRVVVSITPTYSGCPALAEMRADVTGRLTAAGFGRRGDQDRAESAVVRPSGLARPGGASWPRPGSRRQPYGRPQGRRVTPAGRRGRFR